jgi:hypothetical protein
MARSRNPIGLSLPKHDSTSYEVGYGKPPASTRFKAGRSGNPHGRPKGAKNKRPRLNEERLKDIILDEAYRTITVNDGEKKISVPIAQAIVRSLAVNAAKGQHRSQQLFTELLMLTESANRRLHNEYLETIIEYKVEWEKELERRAKYGVVGPEPIPHPDDIVIDLRTGEATVRGPWTKEEKVVWEQLRKRLDDCNEEIRELKKLAADPESTDYRLVIEDDLAFVEKLRDRIASAIGDWPKRRG